VFGSSEDLLSSQHCFRAHRCCLLSQHAIMHITRWLDESASGTSKFVEWFCVVFACRRKSSTICAPSKISWRNMRLDRFLRRLSLVPSPVACGHQHWSTIQLFQMSWSSPRHRDCIDPQERLIMQQTIELFFISD
jgi:hypothetical protein